MREKWRRSFEYIYRIICVIKGSMNVEQLSSDCGFFFRLTDVIQFCVDLAFNNLCPYYNIANSRITIFILNFVHVFSYSNPAMKSLFLLVIFFMAICTLVLAEDNDDPLSDEFINQINEKATTWKVSQKQRDGRFIVFVSILQMNELVHNSYLMNSTRLDETLHRPCHEFTFAI